MFYPNNRLWRQRQRRETTAEPTMACPTSRPRRCAPCLCGTNQLLQLTTTRYRSHLFLSGEYLKKRDTPISNIIVVIVIHRPHTLSNVIIRPYIFLYAKHKVRTVGQVSFQSDTATHSIFRDESFGVKIIFFKKGREVSFSSLNHWRTSIGDISDINYIS